ncbi:Cysteine protease atg4a [Allomyces arbusculus]|nr:Cysteine protease atg4a [Allomyces arbusculus]
MDWSTIPLALQSTTAGAGFSSWLYRVTHHRDFDAAALRSIGPGQLVLLGEHASLDRECALPPAKASPSASCATTPTASSSANAPLLPANARATQLPHPPSPSSSRIPMPVSAPPMVPPRPATSNSATASTTYTMTTLLPRRTHWTMPSAPAAAPAPAPASAARPSNGLAPAPPPSLDHPATATVTATPLGFWRSPSSTAAPAAPALGVSPERLEYDMVARSSLPSRVTLPLPAPTTTGTSPVHVAASYGASANKWGSHVSATPMPIYSARPPAREPSTPLSPTSDYEFLRRGSDACGSYGSIRSAHFIDEDDVDDMPRPRPNRHDEDDEDDDEHQPHHPDQLDESHVLIDSIYRRNSAVTDTALLDVSPSMLVVPPGGRDPHQDLCDDVLAATDDEADSDTPIHITHRDGRPPATHVVSPNGATNGHAAPAAHYASRSRATGIVQRMDTVVPPPPPPPPPRPPFLGPVVPIVPGVDPTTAKALRRFLDRWQALMWFTYRTGLEGDIKSDTSWGCVHRTGQMLLARALLVACFGRDLTIHSFQGTPPTSSSGLPSPTSTSPASSSPTSSTTPAPHSPPTARNGPHVLPTPPSPLAHPDTYRAILSYFEDTRAAPFSLQNICRAQSIYLGERLGSWLSPGTIAHLLARLNAERRLRQHVAGAVGMPSRDPIDFVVHVAKDRIVVTDQLVLAAETAGTPDATVGGSGATPTSMSAPKGTGIVMPRVRRRSFGLGREKVDAASTAAEGAGSPVSPAAPWKPLVLLVPVRLGSEVFHESYAQNVVDLFSWPQFVGIAGGKKDSSLYFPGVWVQPPGTSRTSSAASSPSVDVRLAGTTRSTSPLHASSAGADAAGLSPGADLVRRTHLLYLDPHYPQPVVPAVATRQGGGSAPGTPNASGLGCPVPHPSYHTAQVRSLPMARLDPSMLLGFVLTSRADLDDFVDRVSAWTAHGGCENHAAMPLFSVVEECAWPATPDEDDPRLRDLMDAGVGDDDDLAASMTRESKDATRPWWTTKSAAGGPSPPTPTQSPPAPAPVPVPAPVPLSGPDPNDPALGSTPDQAARSLADGWMDAAASMMAAERAARTPPRHLASHAVTANMSDRTGTFSPWATIHMEPRSAAAAAAAAAANARTFAVPPALAPAPASSSPTSISNETAFPAPPPPLSRVNGAAHSPSPVAMACAVAAARVRDRTISDASLVSSPSAGTLSVRSVAGSFTGTPPMPPSVHGGAAPRFGSPGGLVMAGVDGGGSSRDGGSSDDDDEDENGHAARGRKSSADVEADEEDVRGTRPGPSSAAAGGDVRGPVDAFGADESFGILHGWDED